MQTMTAAEAKQKFGQLIDKVQRWPVDITRHGKSVGVLIDRETYDMERMHYEQWLAERLNRADRDFVEGRTYSEEEIRAEMKAVIVEAATDTPDT